MANCAPLIRGVLFGCAVVLAAGCAKRVGSSKAPAPVLFIRLAAPKIPNGWQPYLAHFGAGTATSTA